ncbi:MAG: VTT domain-containing protein [Candidatus Pacebacteria bacterium]|nr:VTT domain-containing protein [Candidatus Paceibacterota bacterium]
MTEIFINFVEINLVPLGALGVFIASLIEEVIAPIPSALVVAAAGFFLLDGGLSLSFFRDLFFIIAIPASAGVAIGSLVFYFLAYISGKPVLVKWGKWFGLSWSDIEKAQEKFSHTYTDEITLFVLRTIPIVPSVAIAAFCGLIRMNVWKYMGISFLGNLIRASLLGFLGAQAGALYYTYAGTIKCFEDAVLLVFVLAAVFFVVWGAYRTHLSKKRNTLLE